MYRALLLLTAVSLAGPALATRVLFETPLGSFQAELFEDQAPGTVANFLAYVSDGDYERSFIHRMIPGFVVQGGGFVFVEGSARNVPVDDPIANEFGRSNTRGTLAMAKNADDPDSATSQWFINLVDNSEELDASNGGFTVFGEVLGNGMSVVDTLVAQAQVWRFGAPFENLPLLGYPGSGDIAEENFLFTDITVLPEAGGFAINPGLAGAWFDPDTDGQGWFVDVIRDEAGLALFVSWFTYDVEEPPADEDLDFGSVQHRWFTSLGTVAGDTASMDLFRNAGGVFNDPRETALETVGTLSMRFIDCTRAVLSYAFTSGEGGSGEIEVVRLSPDVFCAALAAGEIEVPAVPAR